MTEGVIRVNVFPMRCHALARPLGRRPVKVIGVYKLIQTIVLGRRWCSVGVAHPAAEGECYGCPIQFRFIYIPSKKRFEEIGQSKEYPLA